MILGVWGLETDFGGFAGSNNIIRSLASLAYIHFQGDYFRDELLSALVILEEGDIAPSLMRGSWAGAMGQTQFMPSSYLAYAVAFQRHDRRDIWTNEADAIGSTANYLAKHGWTKGLPWGFEVRLPPKFPLTAADSSAPAPFSSFAARGVTRADGSPLPESGEGRLLILAGLNGPVFLVTSNFDVIKTYNNSTAYALSVGLLGDAVSGGPASRRPMADPRSTADGCANPKTSSQTEENGLRRRQGRWKNRRHAAFGRMRLSGAQRARARRLRQPSVVQPGYRVAMIGGRRACLNSGAMLGDRPALGLSKRSPRSVRSRAQGAVDDG